MLKKSHFLLVGLSVAFLCLLLGIFIGRNIPQGFTVTSGNHSVPATSSGMLDLNTATANQLEMLPGIGPTLARNIIDYRQQNGPFTRPEDLLNVAGIGAKRFNEILDYITVGGSYEDSCS